MKRALFMLLAVLPTVGFAQSAITQTPKYYQSSIQVNYPQFVGMSDTAKQTAINSLLIDNAKKFLAGCIGKPSDVNANINDSAYCNYTSKVDFISNNVAVIEYQQSQHDYAEQGAGRVASKAINLDLTSGTEIKLADLFKANADYATELSNIIKPILQQQYKQTPYNFDIQSMVTALNQQPDFKLTKNGLMIFFQQGSIAPRYFDVIKVEVPYKDLRPLASGRFSTLMQ